MRLAHPAFLALLTCFATSASLRAADADWQRFATSKSATVYFDRASLRAEGGYVHYAVRVDLAQPRETKSGRYRYASALSRFAARCDTVQYAATAIRPRMMVVAIITPGVVTCSRVR